jgi:hypothetical protein
MLKYRWSNGSSSGVGVHQGNIVVENQHIFGDGLMWRPT